MRRNRDKVEHERFMRLAIKLALRGQGKTHPNPLVGAVVVKKGKVIGQGYHKAAGLPHAEVVALNEAGAAARGGSLYVNMEPCCHFGRTPPCTEKIKFCGVKEVILAMLDPNPLNNGKGAQYLRRHRVKVSCGILNEEAKKINQPFIKYITQSLPFVTVKIAQSIDGKIATKSGDSQWISSASSRKLAHRLRAQADAILVGINTVLKDDPLLSCRLNLNGRLHRNQPKKVVVDSRLRLLPNLRIFSSRSPGEVVVATTRFASQAKILDFQKRAEVIVANDKGKKVDLRDLLKRLAQQNISHVLIEGGGELVASALKTRLVDRMIIFVAPKIIGGRNAPTAVEGEGIEKMKQAMRLAQMQVKKAGAEFIITGKPI